MRATTLNRALIRFNNAVERVLLDMRFTLPANVALLLAICWKAGAL